MFKNINFTLYVVFAFILQCSYSRNSCEIAEVCVSDKTCAKEEYLDPMTSVFNCCPTCRPRPAPPGVCVLPANCLPDGRYAPVQCSGDLFTGRCFCANENGLRIFGQMWRDEANEMTCACSRRRSELEALGRVDVSLHCTETGDYEPLQCDSGLCWCAESKTGQPTAPPVLEDDMRRLPCYNPAQQGEQYLRRCESTVHALSVIHREQSEHGTHFIGNPTMTCDYDGSYGPIQIRGGQAYCTGRDGEILGAWQVEIMNISTMNCNCARDTAIYFPARGMSVSEVCQANGNYRPNQVSGEHYYCVDNNGYPTTEFMDAWPPEGCPDVHYF